MPDIQDQLKEKILNGSEEDVRAFIAEHLSEFSEDVQKEFAIEFLKEAMTNDLAERKAVTALKQEMADVIDVIEKAEAMEKDQG